MPLVLEMGKLALRDAIGPREEYNVARLACEPHFPKQLTHSAHFCEPPIFSSCIPTFSIAPNTLRVLFVLLFVECLNDVLWWWARRATGRLKVVGESCSSAEEEGKAMGMKHYQIKASLQKRTNKSIIANISEFSPQSPQTWCLRASWAPPAASFMEAPWLCPYPEHP